MSDFLERWASESPENARLVAEERFITQVTEALWQESIDALLEELEDRYHDTKCGCGHPACRRCQADERTLAVINKAKGETK